ncbi:predicted protein [Naegleria gruberi]|uniref:Predicted protein n=1 Tax=Naegleria gruberi TaxID=5762 RepID=D2W0Q3_NAEGR|nr:uncharacterized protein NAEGRDRAFT_53778 [Naegleria gruberi]EFC37374.1 predicted protein [Naegleria gruberi]|eukprot:XP_002670118.1 predicted protein [Naegleria gruberi strain NEG-M]
MATHSLQSKSTVFPYNSRDVEDQQTTSVDSSVIIKGSSSNYRIEKDEEKKKEARKTSYLACCDFSCSNILNAVAIFCAITACLYSYLYSGGVTKIELVHPIQDRIVSLNSTLYSSEIAEHPNLIPNDEYSNIFSKTLTLMHNCKLHMKGFHGESGIGKTTMLEDSIRLLNPHPYMLISLSETTTIAEIAAQMNMLEKETSWSDIEFTVKKYIDLHSKNLRSMHCPLFIIDNANRNAPIANRFISMVREFPNWNWFVGHIF